MQALWDRVQKKGVLGADFDGSLAGALAGMEFSLHIPLPTTQTARIRTRSRGGQVIRQFWRVSIPANEFKKTFYTEIRFTPERLWSAKSVSKINSLTAGAAHC